MFKFLFKGSFSRPQGAIATILVIAISVVLIYWVFNFQEAIYDYYLGTPDPEAGSSDIIISASASKDSTLVPMGNLKSRDDLSYAIGSIALYCLYQTDDNEEAIYLRTFEKLELETLHEIKNVDPINIDPKTILMDSVIISKSFADSSNLAVGDLMVLSVLGKDANFFIGIIAEDSGYFYNNPNVIVGVSSYIAYLMEWNLGKIYNNIYIGVKNNEEIKQIIELLSVDSNYLYASVKQAYIEEEIRERISVLTTLFDFAAAAIVLLSLLIVYKLYQLMFGKKLSETVKLKTIGLSSARIALLYSGESLMLSIIGATLGSLIALPSFRLILRSALPNANASFSFSHILLAALIIIALSLGMSLIPIIQATNKSIKETMVFSKSPRKKHIFIIPITLAIIYIVLLMLENTIDSTRGIIGLINTILVVAVVSSLAPLITSIWGNIIRKIPTKSAYISTLAIGKNQSLNVAMQMLAVAIILAIFVFNSLNVTTGYNNVYMEYAKDKIVIANAGSLTTSDLNSIEEMPEVSKVMPLLEIQMNTFLDGENEKPIFACGIKGEDLMSFYNVTTDGNAETLKTSLNGEERLAVISDSMKYSYNIKEGDIVKLKYKGIEKEYKIAGFVSTHYQVGKVVFINQSILADDFFADRYNFVYVTTSSPKMIISKIQRTFPQNNIEVLELSSLLAPMLQKQKTINNFIRNFSIFIELLIILSMIINAITSRVQRKTESSKLLLLGVSKREVYLCGFYEALITALPISLLAYFSGLSMVSSSISATIFFGFYQPFSFLFIKSLLISLSFLFVFVLIPPFYLIVSKPSVSAVVSCKRDI